MFESDVNFFSQHRIAFIEIFTALRVTNDNVTDAEALEHFSRHFAGISTRFFVAAILRSYKNPVEVIYFFLRHWQVRKRHRKYGKLMVGKVKLYCR